jgi:hypothetical protein
MISTSPQRRSSFVSTVGTVQYTFRQQRREGEAKAYLGRCTRLKTADPCFAMAPDYCLLTHCGDSVG